MVLCYGVSTLKFFPASPLPRSLTQMPIWCLDVLGLHETGRYGFDWSYAEDLGDGRGITLTTAGITDEDRALMGWTEKITVASWGVKSKSSATRAKVIAYIQKEYGAAAIQAFRARGFIHPITLSFLFDTVIQHGNGKDPDSFGIILKTADRYLARGEYEYLSVALRVRRSILLNPSNKETKEVWRESTGRIDWYEEWLNSLLAKKKIAN
jgi:Glycosyl hydrolase family 46